MPVISDFCTSYEFKTRSPLLHVVQGLVNI